MTPEQYAALVLLLETMSQRASMFDALDDGQIEHLLFLLSEMRNAAGRVYQARARLEQHATLQEVTQQRDTYQHVIVQMVAAFKAVEVHDPRVAAALQAGEAALGGANGG